MEKIEIRCRNGHCNRLFMNYYVTGNNVDWSGTTSATNVGTYTARIEAKTTSGYTGIGKSVTYTITPYEFSDAEWKAIAFTLNDAVFAGENTKAFSARIVAILTET